MLIHKTKWYITEEIEEKRYRVHGVFRTYNEASAVRNGQENKKKLYVQRGQAMLEQRYSNVKYFTETAA